MKKLKVMITVTSLSDLVPVGPDQYAFTVLFLDSQGLALSSPYVPDVFDAVVQTSSVSFVIEVPIVEASYTYNDVTVRVLGNQGADCCKNEMVIDIVNDEPPTGELIDVCSSNNSADGIGGTHTFYWTNNTPAQQDVYWEWYTSAYPDRLQVMIDGEVWHDTHCAGPQPNTCVPPGKCCYQEESTYGRIDVPVGSMITFQLDGDCSNTGGTVWNLKTLCAPFAQPPVIYDGSAAVCTIQILDFDTLSAGAIYINKWTGGLSGEYEFACQAEALADIATAIWMQDNSSDPGAGMFFGGLPSGVEYRVWIRDKVNPSCFSFINAIP
ncbi:hypothetical protein [Dyadobacter sp. BHUBP1]|uniref:hypothetical protein n=1 Tax=Dyadobacter sp. BHUBP1 TaxID=3424178 RepID=UPI003D32F750